MLEKIIFKITMIVMKNIKILLFSLVFTAIAAFIRSDVVYAQSSSPNQLRIVIYGNDLTSNSYLPPDKTFSAQLGQRLRSGGFDVVVENVNDPDRTSVKALLNLDELVGRAPDLVILQLGEADVNLRLPMAAFCDNMIKIIKELKKRNVYVIIIGVKKTPRLEAQYSAEIDKNFSKLHGYAPVLMNPLEGAPDIQDLTLGDGHHPNARGIASIIDAIYPPIDAGLRWKIGIINEWRAKNTTNF